MTTDDSESAADFDPDDLAGVVDLFGALTRSELRRALEELAFRRGRDLENPDAAISAAVEGYHLVEYERDRETLLTVGPVAFPTLPPDAEDLPHILDVPERSVDREALATAVERRLRGDAARAVDAEDVQRLTRLLDVTYDIETWAAVSVDGIRDQLDRALQD